MNKRLIPFKVSLGHDDDNFRVNFVNWLMSLETLETCLDMTFWKKLKSIFIVIVCFLPNDDILQYAKDIYSRASWIKSQIEFIFQMFKREYSRIYMCFEIYYHFLDSDIHRFKEFNVKFYFISISMKEYSDFSHSLDSIKPRYFRQKKRQANDFKITMCLIKVKFLF